MTTLTAQAKSVTRKIVVTAFLLTLSAMLFVIGWVWSIFLSKTDPVKAVMIRGAIGGAGIALFVVTIVVFIVMYWLGFRFVRTNKGS